MPGLSCGTWNLDPHCGVFSCGMGTWLQPTGSSSQIRGQTPHWQLGFLATGSPGESLSEHFDRIASQSAFGAIAAFHACALVKILFFVFFSLIKRACSARLSKGEGGKNRKALEDGGQG